LIIPSGYSEAQVIGAINYVAMILAPKFTFPPFTRDDIEQEARSAAVFVLNKNQFDMRKNPNKSPEERLLSFLSVSVHNLLKNFKRKHLGTNTNQERWQEKVNLHFFLPIDNIDDQNETNTRINETCDSRILHDELMRLIEQNLEPEFRPTYFKMLSGVNVSKVEREKLLGRLREILNVEEEVSL